MRSRRFWFLASVALTVGLCAFGAKLWLIREYGNPTPYMDQWDAEAATVYLPHLRGELGWFHFWAPHNEHRIVWTRLLALGLLEANGQWDPLLQMSVNALLHSVFAGALVVWIAGQLRGAAFAAGALLITALFTLPFAWENTLGGFQSQFYFLAWFAFGHLVLTLGTRPGSWRWWLGLVCGVAGLGASSGGFAAPLASATTVGAGALLRRERCRWTWIHLGVAVASAVTGLASVHHVAGHDELRARSLAQFLEALLNTAGWPANFWLPLGLLTVAPFLVWAGSILLRRVWTAGEAVLLGLGAWALLQCAALALSRGNLSLGSAPRYDDLFALLVLSSAVVLGRWIGSEESGRPRRVGLAAGWLAVLSAGLVVQTRAAYHLSLDPLQAEWQHSTALVAGYVRGGDRATFAALDQALLPYPSAPAMADWLDQPEIRRILPAALREPVHLQFVTSSPAAFAAGLAPGLPADRDAVAGSRVWSLDRREHATLVRSAPLSARLLPVLQFRLVGDAQLPANALRLEPLDKGAGSAPARTRWLGTRWQTANLPRPDGTCVVVAEVPPGQALAFADPVEMGRWSWFNRHLLKSGFILFVAGAALLSASLTAGLVFARSDS